MDVLLGNVKVYNLLIDIDDGDCPVCKLAYLSHREGDRTGEEESWKCSHCGSTINRHGDVFGDPSWKKGQG